MYTCGQACTACPWHGPTQNAAMLTTGGIWSLGAELCCKCAMHYTDVKPLLQAVYTQQKFNLLREESEGFSKLLTVLNRFGAAALSPASVPGLVSRLPC